MKGYLLDTNLLIALLWPSHERHELALKVRGVHQVNAQRGGAGRGQGRKPIKQGEDTVTVSLRLTAAQRDKLARLGGAEWVRQRIDKARET